MNRFISFDIEIATTIPEGVEDWSTLHPLGITCAATWASDENRPRVWCGRDDWGAISAQMMQDELIALVAHLDDAVADGYKIVSLNGAGFDFRELAMSSGQHEICKDLAWNHYDLFFTLFCILGYAPGLNAIAQGMGCGSKTVNVDGAKAPELWQNGKYGQVLDYVANDAKLTLDVAQAVKSCGEVRWTSKSGRPQVVNVDQWLTVRESIELELPDNSWMKGKGWERSKFVGWLG